MSSYSDNPLVTVVTFVQSRAKILRRYYFLVNLVNFKRNLSWVWTYGLLLFNALIIIIIIIIPQSYFSTVRSVIMSDSVLGLTFTLKNLFSPFKLFLKRSVVQSFILFRFFVFVNVSPCVPIYLANAYLN